MLSGLKRHLVLTALASALFACNSGSAEQFPVPMADDGGGTVPVLGDGGVGTKITVTIEGPKPGDIVPGKTRFTPTVNVALETAGDAMADTVAEVKATVVSTRDPDGPSASNTLNVTKIDRILEPRTATYRYLETPVDLSLLSSGEYELRATVRTAGGQMGEARVKFLVDAGPTITIESPGKDRSYRSAARVEVLISDMQFGPVENVSMSVGPRPLRFEAPTAAGGRYTANIVFKDYDPPLEGEQLLTVRAQNRNKTETVAVVRFIADDKGPIITNTVPKVGELIGKVITISAQVTDTAGVLDSSVMAVIAHGDMTFEVKLRPTSGGTMMMPGIYSALFDTTRLPPNALFPSVSFRASDMLGNESSVGYLVSLDITPPLADLDPPTDLRLRKKDDKVWRCSWRFDPLGSDAINDGARTLQLFDIRARIEDQGNDTLAGGADFTPIAGVDEARAQLLVLDETSRPLVVDTNNDGICDAVNPLLTPTTKPTSATDALLVNMVPVPPGGGADFTPDPSAVIAGVCESGKDDRVPDPLCTTTDLLTTISYTTGSTPSIWTVPPIVGDKLQCVGRQFDTLGNSVADGWICAAVLVADKLGNSQVSRPLRICIDKDNKGDECANTANMPNCTGTVTAPGPPATVDATKSCKPWRLYPNGEIKTYL